ncbi:MAG: PDZ domain-containing protein [Verrucomicrobia bacterium]|nr:PDZ domain-containing protein [Verrucomicrobiota bacterium]
MKKWVVGFFCLISTLYAASERHQLRIADVRNSMEEMFSYHVETREMTPTLIKRSFKIYLEQFDPQRIYLTQAEVKPFLELSTSQIESIINHYYSDDYPEFATLNKTIVQAIQRARKWREELYADFLKEGEAVSVSNSDISSAYCSNPSQLKKQLRAQLIHLFKLENRGRDPQFWTTERRQKICALFEKRFAHYEDSYLTSLEKGEHYFAMHILKAMARGLDAHTSFFSPEEATEMRSSLEKQFEGVGIVLREGLDGVEISDLVKGGPAARSGKIQVGDILVEIDGKPIVSASYYDVLNQLKGDGRKDVALGVKRSENGTDNFVKVSLRREKIIMEDERLVFSSEPFADGIIAKLTLPSFYESSDSSSCEADIREALKNLRKKGKILGLVLDLRNNLGGFLAQAVKVSGLFMTSGVVVISKYAEGEIQYLRNLDPRIHYNGPMVILTSKISASAAEIVAQALQDYGVGIVVGDERTYGKGTIQYQTVTDTSAASFFKVTVGRYYTVSGRSTQIEGVKADIVVPTLYSAYNIGERYLEYALKNDQISPAYADPLTDVPAHTQLWFQKNYLPYLQKRESAWVQMVPKLKTNSSYRLDHDADFQVFLKKMDHDAGELDAGVNDLQMSEAVSIVKDMINLK